jgi:hypothetical protein
MIGYDEPPAGDDDAMAAATEILGYGLQVTVSGMPGRAW